MLDYTIHPFTSPSPTFRSSAFKADSEAETGNRPRRALLLGGILREGRVWVQKVAGCIFPPARRGAPQMLAPSPRVSPHTEPTSICRTISPIPAPVTSTVVAQPNPKRRIWVSRRKLRRQKSAGITPVISGKTLEKAMTA